MMVSMNRLEVERLTFESGPAVNSTVRPRRLVVLSVLADVLLDVGGYAERLGGGELRLRTSGITEAGQDSRQLQPRGVGAGLFGKQIAQSLGRALKIAELFADGGEPEPCFGAQIGMRVLRQRLEKLGRAGEVALRGEIVRGREHLGRG